MSLRTFSVYDFFRRNARSAPDSPAVVCGEQRIGFAELNRQIDTLAAGLAQQGIGRGDRVALLALNTPRYLLMYGVAAAMGAILVPLNWRLAAEEIGYILADAAPKVTLVDEPHSAIVRGLEAQDVPTGRILGIDAACRTSPCIDDLVGTGPFVPPAINPDDPFVIIYTAAMEGKPRGAVLSHANVVAGNMQTIATLQLTPADAYLNMLPLFHITGINLALATLHAGGKNVVMEKFDRRVVWQQTETEAVSVLGSFPPILSELTAELDETAYDTASLRCVVGLDSQDAIAAFEQKTGSTFWTLYGQTETAGMITLAPDRQKPGSAGKAGLLAEIDLVDDHDRPVATGQSGEIVVRGPLVFQGFWQQGKIEPLTFRNERHYTGDLGRWDDEGYLWFEGRKPEKELIKPGGENVYPAEVEKVVLAHPAVAEVTVIGVPDPKFGEGIKAVCVLKAGHTLTAADLIEFVAGRIARYKKPRYVEFVAVLPRTASGAIDRNEVKKQYGQE